MASCFPSAALVAPAPASTNEQNPPDPRLDHARPQYSKTQVIGFATLTCLAGGAFILYFGYWAVGMWDNFNIMFADFQVDSLSFSPPNINNSAPPRTAEWKAQVSVRNLSKYHRVHFRDVQVSVWYNNGTEWLSTVRVESFWQRPKARTEVRANPKARLGNCGATAIFDNVTRDINGDDDDDHHHAYFGLRLSAKAAYPLKFPLLNGYIVTSYDYFCKNLKLGFSPTSGEWKMVENLPPCFETIGLVI